MPIPAASTITNRKATLAVAFLLVVPLGIKNPRDQNEVTSSGSAQ